MVGNNHCELIGSLKYVARATRMNISFAITKLAPFLTDLGRVQLEAALRILQYLKGTKGWNINIGESIADIAGVYQLRLGRGSRWSQADREVFSEWEQRGIMENEAKNICGPFIRGGKVYTAM